MPGDTGNAERARRPAAVGGCRAGRRRAGGAGGRKRAKAAAGRQAPPNFLCGGCYAGGAGPVWRPGEGDTP